MDQTQLKYENYSAGLSARYNSAMQNMDAIFASGLFNDSGDGSGGYDGEKCFNEIDILDLDTMTWISPQVQGTIPMARNAPNMAVLRRFSILASMNPA